jgi:hypothetical protein
LRMDLRSVVEAVMIRSPRISYWHPNQLPV